MSKVLIVDDDLELARHLAEFLSKQGWTVESVHTGADAMQVLSNFQFDLVLLDWNLPDHTGLVVCKDFRGRGGVTPIIFLTGVDDLDCKIDGFESGADDYLEKPFEPRELIARIHAIQRRPKTLVSNELVVGEVKLDPRAKTLAFSNDCSIKLTATEASILELLFRNPNQHFTASQLFAHVWPSTSDATEDTVRVHMRILRKKLALVDVEGLIETVRGAGYTIRSDWRTAKTED